MMPVALAETTVSSTIDFTDALTTALNGIQADFVKYAGIAIAVGFAVWSAPMAIQLVKKFFKGLVR